MKEQKEIPMKTESTTLSGNFDNTKLGKLGTLDTRHDKDE